MKVTIEKFDVSTGTTAKRDFELDTDTILLSKSGITLAYTSGDPVEIEILCKDSEKVDFISVTIYYENGHITIFTFDTIAYYYDNVFRTLAQKGDEF